MAVLKVQALVITKRAALLKGRLVDWCLDLLFPAKITKPKRNLENEILKYVETAFDVLTENEVPHFEIPKLKKLLFK